MNLRFIIRLTLCQQRFCSQQPINPGQRGQAALGKVGYPAHRHHWPDEHVHVGDKGYKITQCDGVIDHQPATEVQHQQHPNIANQRGNRKKQPLNNSNLEIACNILPAQGLKVFNLLMLSCIAFDQPYRNHCVTGKFSKQGKLFLYPVEPLMQPAGQDPGTKCQ